MGFIMTVLGMVLAAFAIGAILGALLFVIAFIYCLPYTVWVSWNAGTNGIPPVSEQAMQTKSKWRISHEVKNATKVYRSWITKKPHGITKF